MGALTTGFYQAFAAGNPLQAANMIDQVRFAGRTPEILAPTAEAFLRLEQGFGDGATGEWEALLTGIREIQRERTFPESRSAFAARIRFAKMVKGSPPAHLRTAAWILANSGNVTSTWFLSSAKILADIREILNARDIPPPAWRTIHAPWAWKAVFESQWEPWREAVEIRKAEGEATARVAQEAAARDTASTLFGRVAYWFEFSEWGPFPAEAMEALEQQLGEPVPLDEEVWWYLDTREGDISAEERFRDIFLFFRSLRECASENPALLSCIGHAIDSLRMQHMGRLIGMECFGVRISPHLHIGDFARIFANRRWTLEIHRGNPAHLPEIQALDSLRERWRRDLPLGYREWEAEADRRPHRRTLPLQLADLALSQLFRNIAQLFPISADNYNGRADD